MDGTKLLDERLNAQIPSVAFGTTTNHSIRSERPQGPEAVFANDFSIPANVAGHHRPAARHCLQQHADPTFVMDVQSEDLGRG